MPRYLSIDILRGLAIILMIQIHFVENLSPREEASAWLYDLSIFLGSFPAPFFTFVSGLSFALWLRRQKEQGRRDEAITLVTVRRGLFLFGIGIAFNFFLWLPEDTFNWDVLTLIGSALLLLAVARKLPAPVLALLCVMILLASPPMRVVGDYHAYWVEDDTYTYDFTMRDVLFGYLANGFFPIMPWILFPLMGFLIGDWIFRPAKQPVARLWRLALLGLLLLGLSGGLFWLGTAPPALVLRHYAEGFSEFPASTPFVLAMLGCAFLSLALLHRWVDRMGIEGNGLLFRMVRRYSAFSLTVYILHHMVILWPLWAYGAWMGHEDVTAYWRLALDTPTALLLSGGFVVICPMVLIVLEKKRTWSVEAWMRWLCD